MLADLVVYNQENEMRLVLPEGTECKILETLQKYLIMDDATVALDANTTGPLCVYGEESARFLQHFFQNKHNFFLPLYAHTTLQTPTGHSVLVAATADLGMPGYHLFGERPALEEIQKSLSNDRPLSAEEAHQLRVEAGIPLYGVDMDEERLPMEANLESTLSFDKGCYLGQEVLVRVNSRGHVNRKLVGVVFPTLATPPPVGSNLIHETRDNAGTIFSGTKSNTYGTIALAYVHRTLLQPGTRLFVAPRETPAGAALPTAIVVSLPFASSQDHIKIH